MLLTDDIKLHLADFSIDDDHLTISILFILNDVICFRVFLPYSAPLAVFLLDNVHFDFGLTYFD